MAIIIKDLPFDKELDQQAMASVRGGLTGTPLGQPGPAPSNPFGGEPDGIQVNSSPDQSFWSFTRSPTDLAKKHTY
jgi:hypothetical protein